MSWSCTFARGYVASIALLLAGCATFSPDGGVDRVRKLVSERIGAPVALPASSGGATQMLAATRDLLGKPLTADAAMQVALLNNPGVTVRIAALGIAESDWVAAGRLANPRFSFGNRHSSDVASINRTVLFSVMSLIAMPLSQAVAKRQFESAQLQLAGDVLQLAADTRRAYFYAVAAQQIVKYFEQAHAAAGAGADLAAKMAAAGNFSKLTEMREQAFLADTTAQLAKAKLASAIARERLGRLMGTPGPDMRFELPDRLPELPDAPVVAHEAEQSAMDQRLDVMLAKRNADATAANLGLVKVTRMVNVLELGYSNESNSGERRLSGYEIDVELPLFDWGDAKLARAEATYRQALAHTAVVAVNARSQLREAYQSYRTSFDVARHYRDEVVPLHKRIADENLLRYNGMLISVFELLADAREQIASVTASIEALRDFWIADAGLQQAQNGSASDVGSPISAITMPFGDAAGAH